MIFIKKITINGFKSPTKVVEVDFSEHQSSVIFGENGCGKTTFLKILNALFRQDDNVLIEEEVNSIVIEYKVAENGKIADPAIEWQHKNVVVRKIIDEMPEPDVHDLFMESSSSIRYDWDKFVESELVDSKSLSLGVDRGNQSTRLNLNSRLLFNFIHRKHHLRTYFKNTRDLREFSDDLLLFIRRRNESGLKGTNFTDYSDNHVFLKEVNMDNIEDILLGRYRNARRSAARKIQNALFDTLASAISEQEESGPQSPQKIPDNFNEIISKNKELLIEALDDKSENSFKDTIVNELRKIHDDKDVEALRDNSLLIKLLLEMSAQLKDTESELSAINTVIDRFDEFTGDGKKLFINNSEIKVKIGNGKHSISKLSSGERHILTLFTLLLDQGRKRNFIIIDEPEISLNTKWQEALLPTLEELMPSCQIITASHSPIIAESIDNLAELHVISEGENFECDFESGSSESDDYL